MITEPDEVGLASVRTTSQGVSVMVLRNEGVGKIAEPAIVRRRLADPARTRMILMSGLIAMDTGLRRGRGIYVRRWTVVENMLCRPQKLRGLEYHLDNMLVAMPLCGNRSDRVKKEDVHLATMWVRYWRTSSFRRHQKGMRRGGARLVPGTPGTPTLTPGAPSYMTSTVDNKRVITRDLYVRDESGANPGGDTVPRFGADGKIQFSTVTVDSGGSLGVPGSAVIQGNLTVNGLINGGSGGGGGGGGVSVAAGPSRNVTVATTASVATVDLAPALSGVDISGDIDVTGRLEAKSLRVLTGAIVDGAFSANSVNVISNADVGGALDCDSTITAEGTISSRNGDIEAINGILSGILAVNGAATVGSLNANQTVTVAGKLMANAADISTNVVVGGDVDVSGVVTARGLILRNAFVVDTLQVRGEATISGDLFVNGVIDHKGFRPPIGGNTVLEGGAGISVTQDPDVSEKWTIEYTGGGSGGSGGISGINAGSNIQVLTSGDINPIVSVRINETLDMCYNKIANVDIIELVSTAMDTEDPRIGFKDVNGVQRAQVEYNQDNQAEPLLLVEGPRVLIEASEADNVSGVTLATAGNTLTVTNMSVDLAVPLLTMDGVEIAVDGSKNMVIDNTNTGGGYRFTSVPDVSGASGFDKMLVYEVGTGEIRQMPAPMGTDICGGTNILVDKSTPAEPVVSLEVREDVDMGGKGLVFASSIGFSNGGSLAESVGKMILSSGDVAKLELTPAGGVEIHGISDKTGAPYGKVIGYDDVSGLLGYQNRGIMAVNAGTSGNITTATDLGTSVVTIDLQNVLTGIAGMSIGTRNHPISGLFLYEQDLVIANSTNRFTTNNFGFTRNLNDGTILGQLIFPDVGGVSMGGGDVMITGKLAISASSTQLPPTKMLEVDGEVQAKKLYLTEVAPAASAHPKVLGYNSGTNEIELQDAASGGGSASIMLTPGKNIDFVSGAVTLAIDEAVDMCGQNITNAASVTASVIDISGSAIIGSGTTGNLRLTHQFGETFIESGVGRTVGSAAPLHFTDYNAQHTWMTIGSTGDVGIGTATPLNTLHVKGSIVTTRRSMAIALGAGGSTIRYSYDGQNWNNGSGTLFSTNGYNAAANGTMWVAVGKGGVTITHSNDGINWNNTSVGAFTTQGRGIVWNELHSRWVAVGEDSAQLGSIKYSSDGITWQNAGSNTFSTRGYCIGTSITGDRWVAGGEGGVTIKYSSDGINWIDSTDAFTVQCTGIAHSGAMWVATGEGDRTIKWSNDGITWNNATSGDFIISTYAVTYGDGLWVATGFPDTANIVLKYSVDGKVWINADSGGEAQIATSVAYTSDVNGRNIWIAACAPVVPSTSGVKYSYDGKNWVDAQSGAHFTPALGVSWGPAITTETQAKVLLTSIGRDCTLLSAGVGSNPAFYWRSNATYYKANFAGTAYFTGQHANVMVTPTITSENVSDYVGLIVSSADDGYCSIDDTGRLITGIDAIWTTEALPRIKLTDKDRDKAVWGVITNHRNGMKGSGGSNDTDDTTEWGTSLHGRIRVNGVGEGAMWVLNINGPLENGDYICSSEVPGYGRRQDDDLLHNYTVAKITMSCAFELGQNTYRCEEFEWRGQMLRRAYVGCTYHCS